MKQKPRSTAKETNLGGVTLEGQGEAGEGGEREGERGRRRGR